MDMRPKQEKLAQEYKYKPLPPLFSILQQQEYLDNIPDEFKNYIPNTPVYSKSGIKICSSLTDRVFVCGDYGVFLEANEANMLLENITVKPGEEYRIDDARYRQHAKYEWLCPSDLSDVKIYHQLKTVTYADYQVGKYYFSPYEVTVKP